SRLRASRLLARSLLPTASAQPLGLDPGAERFPAVDAERRPAGERMEPPGSVALPPVPEKRLGEERDRGHRRDDEQSKSSPVARPGIRALGPSAVVQVVPRATTRLSGEDPICRRDEMADRS